MSRKSTQVGLEGAREALGVPDSEQDEPMGFLVHEVANAISQAYGALMAPLGLTRPQMRVLVWVDQRPGISQAKLSELIGTSAMAMTGLLDRMEAKNLIRRE
ncbi:MAG: MarR family transcriptional regulator, partial [Gammaproteobacteria bacterium]